MTRMLTGERPTGPLHIGHLFGTVANRVRLQQSGVETFLVLADYQVITDREVAGDVAGSVHEIVLDYLAAGIDPDAATIFTHSAVPPCTSSCCRSCRWCRSRSSSATPP